MQDRRRRQDPQGGNEVKQSVDLRSVAKAALVPIDKKLRGLYSKDANRSHRDKEISTGNLVQALIEEATDSKNLVSIKYFSRRLETDVVQGENVRRMVGLALTL